jgi:hypothetical protein
MSLSAVTWRARAPRRARRALWPFPLDTYTQNATFRDKSQRAYTTYVKRACGRPERGREPRPHAGETRSSTLRAAPPAASELVRVEGRGVSTQYGSRDAACPLSTGIGHIASFKGARLRAVVPQREVVHPPPACPAPPRALRLQRDCHLRRNCHVRSKTKDLAGTGGRAARGGWPGQALRVLVPHRVAQVELPPYRGVLRERLGGALARLDAPHHRLHLAAPLLHPAHKAGVLRRKRLELRVVCKPLPRVAPRVRPPPVRDRLRNASRPATCG